MKVAAIQLNAGSDKQANVISAVRLVEEAARHGAEFICLPEVFNYRGRVTAAKLISEIAEEVPGPSTLPLATIAREKKVFILAGSVFERAPGQKKAYNTAVVFDPRGRVIGKYSKKNLFETRVGNWPIREAKNFLPGRKSCACRVKEFKVGVSICYDFRFPEIYQAYRQQGCQVFAVPSAFTRKTGQAHWEVLARAHAIENLCYLIGPNQTGIDGYGIAAYGNSLIISPWGEILARASDDKEEIIYADIQLNEIKRVRKILPSLFKGR